MSLSENGMGNGFYMPVAPAYAGGMGNGFGNGFGGDGWWLILLLLCCNGGWGGGFGGFGGAQLGYDFPWLLNGQNNINANTNSGFRDAMLNDGINGIRDNITDISTQLCNGFNNTQMALANGFAGVEQGANSRQMANMQTAFNQQTAMNAGFNGVQSQLANCCCENRLATNDVKYTIANEACSTRATDTQNTQAILNAISDGFKAMSDQRYQDKIDAKNDEIAQLRQENLYARGQASQIAQDQRIVDGIYNRLSTCPVDTTPVFGRSPIFTCATNLSNNNIGGCSCGCGNGNF